MQINIHVNIDDRLLAGPRWLKRHPIALGLLLVGIGSATAMAVVDPGDFTNGTTIDASAVNTRFKRLYDAVGALEGGLAVDDGVVSLPNQSFVSWRGTINPLADSNSAFPIGTVVVDRRSELDAGQSAFVPADAGTYLITGSWDFGALAADCQAFAYVQVNGGRVNGLSEVRGHANMTEGAGLSHLIQLAAGDVVRIIARASCTTEVTGWFGVARLH